MLSLSIFTLHTWDEQTKVTEKSKLGGSNNWKFMVVAVVVIVNWLSNVRQNIERFHTIKPTTEVSIFVSKKNIYILLEWRSSIMENSTSCNEIRVNFKPKNNTLCRELNDLQHWKHCKTWCSKCQTPVYGVQNLFHFNISLLRRLMRFSQLQNQQGHNILFHTRPKNY